MVEAFFDPDLDYCNICGSKIYDKNYHTLNDNFICFFCWKKLYSQ